MSHGGEVSRRRDRESGHLQTFRREAGARLDRIVAALTAARDEGAGPDAAAAVFRDVHTLKGAAGMLELDEAHRLASAMEQALERQAGSIPPALADRLLPAAGALRLHIAGGRGSVEDIVRELEQALQR